MIHYCFWKGKEYGRNIHTYPLYEDLAGTIAKSPNAGKRKQAILRTSFILHIYVDTTTLFVKNRMRPYAKVRDSMTIVYAQVLDTIKGKTLPNINTGIIATQPQLDLSNAEESINLSPVGINIPDSVNLIFEYCNQWNVSGRGGVSRAPNGKILLDKLTHNWIKPGKEYIVSLALNLACRYNGLFYYALWPIAGAYSFGMYPIEDGNVLDIGNVWGWGESVPLNVFKQNLNALLNEIKNYGE